MPATVFAQVEIQGHRGARGLYPENTIPGFLHAIKLGVNTIELDVVISKNKKVVVSHDTWISGKICTGVEGEVIRPGDKSYNIYEMTYDEIKKCDCGGMVNPDFPEQVKLTAYKPLLEDVIKAVESSGLNPDIIYNIELKASPSTDNTFHPQPHEFSALVQQVIKDVPKSRIIIQSFDPRILTYWKTTYGDYTLSFLTASVKSWKSQIKTLGFDPQIYSPYYKLLTKKAVAGLQNRGLKVVPWTVNTQKEMQVLLEMGVDGLITDYPDRAIEVIRQ